jgi:hypothetical protein
MRLASGRLRGACCRRAGPDEGGRRQAQQAGLNRSTRSLVATPPG